MTEYVQAIHSGVGAGDALSYQSVFGCCARVLPPLPSLPGAGNRALDLMDTTLKPYWPHQYLYFLHHDALLCPLSFDL